MRDPGEFILVCAGMFGAVVGSFLNVCIYRLPRQCLSIVKPRSRCPNCLKLIAWFDNLPVVSYIVLGGRCRGCKISISPRYPLVEMLTAAMFVFAAWRAVVGPVEWNVPEAWAKGFVLVVVTGLLIVATFIDWDFRIIPHEVTLGGLAFGLIVSTAFPGWHEWFRPFDLPRVGVLANQRWLAGLVAGLFGGFVGGGIIYVIGVIAEIAFRKEAMGFGDVLLMLFVGSLLGWRWVAYTFFLGCVFGAVGGSLTFLVKKDHYIAFGPYLAIGTLAVLFGGGVMLDDWLRPVFQHVFGIRI